MSPPLPSLQYDFDQYQDEYDDTYDSHSVGAADSETAEDLFTVKRCVCVCVCVLDSKRKLSCWSNRWQGYMLY